eukprot:5959047-Lingulodinium_polyedra.AAC.1
MVCANSASAMYAQTLAVRCDCPLSGLPVTTPGPTSRNRVASVMANRTARGDAGASREAVPW